MDSLEVELQQSLKIRFKCDTNYKKEFSESHCLLTISVGQEVHEGPKLLAAMKLANQHFRQCTILVDDTLQRHSHSIFCDDSDEELYVRNLQLGDMWLERNQHIYGLITKPLDIIRWDKWLKHEDYPETYASISDLYQTDHSFKKAMDNSAVAFVERQQKRIPSLDYERAFSKSIDYLKEECAAFCLWSEGGYHFEVYPGRRNSALVETHRRFVEPKTPNLLRAVALKFKE